MHSEPLATIGIDLGGTRYRVGWFGPKSRLEGVQTYETRGHRPVGEVLPEIAAAVESARLAASIAGAAVAAIGIGVAAVLDDAGRILLAPNLSRSWQGFPLAAKLAELTGTAVYALNDARSYTLAESRVGAGQGVSNMLGVTVGTGVGGGLVLDGKLRFGPNNMAGEMGHTTYDPRGPRCGCGGLGCIESYAAGPAIAAAALRLLLQGQAPVLRTIIGTRIAGLTADAVATAAQQGERECQEIFERVGDALGFGIASVMKIVDIEHVVIGGGVLAAGNAFFDPLREAVRRNAPVFGGYVPQIAPARVIEAGATGAAIWALECLGADAARTRLAF